jgi:hypothetical protein
MPEKLNRDPPHDRHRARMQQIHRLPPHDRRPAEHPLIRINHPLRPPLIVPLRMHPRPGELKPYHHLPHIDALRLRGRHRQPHRRDIRVREHDLRERLVVRRATYQLQGAASISRPRVFLARARIVSAAARD